MRIKEMRIIAGISQCELAEKLGVNQTAVSQWERNSSMPSSEKLPMIADALGCSIDELFGRDSA